MFEAVTRDIRIQVIPSFVAEQSSPAEGHYFFSYRIRIQNESAGTVQLLSRHWIIKDAFGKMEEVEGPGVVGQQPKLKPGDVFEYSSFCPLATPTGSMQGTYLMIDEEGRQWNVEIPLFILSEPNHFH